MKHRDSQRTGFLCTAARLVNARAFRKRVGAGLTLAVLPLALPVAVSSTSGCGPYCRDIEATELPVDCESPPRFTGEIHFDNLATFDTFLRQQCLPTASVDEIEAIEDQVDFDTHAVFVAVGPAAIDNTRCVTRRDLDRAQVCSDGLKVVFDDDYASADEGCTGARWTVAFSLTREDLRAALEAGETAEAQ
jgi:hypothetical protein